MVYSKTMKEIVVASLNPVKITATSEGFKKMFPGEQLKIRGVEIPSGVSDQPMTDGETFRGALNRVENVSRIEKADFWVGIEGGIEKRDGELGVQAWIIIKSKEQKIGKGRTGTFFLPERMKKLILLGKELGEASDVVFNDNNSKQKRGSIGELTGDAIDRTQYYVDAVIFALIPFKNKELY